MLQTFKFALGSAILVAAISLNTGCTPPSAHPNQINKFDGAAYDSLVLAHGSLASLRESIPQDYPKLAPSFNKVAEAYRTAVIAYSLYRSNANAQVNLSNALHTLTLTLVALETDLGVDLHSGSSTNGTAQAHISYSPSELLVELELAASIASVIPATQAEAKAAQVILAATRQAFAEWQAVASQPIDLSLLQPIEAIS